MPYYYSPFRVGYQAPNDRCAFCSAEILKSQSVRNANDAVVENEHYLWLVNWFPRCEAHTLIVPKRHFELVTDETESEVLARQDLTKKASAILQRAFPESGFEVFFQTGRNSLSSVPHLHWHVVPALPNQVLPGFEKNGYFSTTKPEEEKVVLTPVTITLGREELIEKLRPFVTEEE